MRKPDNSAQMPKFREAGVRVRASLHRRQPAVAVGQRLGSPADPLAGPGRLGQRPVRVQGDGLALDVDLAGRFPVTADGGIRQPGIPGRHHVRVVVQDPPDDLLGDVPVDQLGPRGYLYRKSQSAW